MSPLRAPPWYQAGNIEDSIRDALKISDVTSEEIVDTLEEHEFEASRERISTMVETTRNQLTEQSSELESPDKIREDLRNEPVYFVGPPDLEYLGRRDAAFVIGAMLSRYTGSFSVPETIDERAVDLFWNRPRTTISFRLELTCDGVPVGTDTVHAVAEGETTPVSGRAPSKVGIVSNTGFTANVEPLASEYDLHCYGPAHLRRWCRDAKLTRAVVGKIVDEGDRTVDEIYEIVEQLQPVPDSVSARDPLEAVAEPDWTVSTLDRNAGDQRSPDRDEAKDNTATQSQANGDELGAPDDPGQRGVLYADPDEDGDFGAFDRFENALAEEENE